MPAINITSAPMPDRVVDPLKDFAQVSIKIFALNAVSRSFVSVVRHSCMLRLRQAQITDRPSEVPAAGFSLKDQQNMTI